MDWLLILAVVFAALVVLALLKGGAGTAKSIGYPYKPAPAMFSAAERSFLGALDLAVGPDYRVFGKVRVADLASVKPGLGNSARQAALNRISGKHFDFVVCRGNDLAVMCAVELDDKSHAGQRSRKRDEFVSEVCRTIGLPLIQVPARAGYEVGELRGRFAAAIGEPPPGATALPLRGQQ